MNEMEQFRHNAERLGLCDTFAQKWSACRSKKQLYDLACDVNSLEYLADMIARGHGLPPEYLTKEFGQFLNGKYIHKDNGYTSCIYCQPPEDAIKIGTTATLIIGFKGAVVVERPCRLYLCKSDVTIIGTTQPEAYLYNSSVVSDNCFVKVEEWKQY